MRAWEGFRTWRWLELGAGDRQISRGVGNY